MEAMNLLVYQTSWFSLRKTPSISTLSNHSHSPVTFTFTNKTKPHFTITSQSHQPHNPDKERRNTREKVHYLAYRIKALPKKRTERLHFVTLLNKDEGFMSKLDQFNDLLMALVVADEPDLALELYSNMSSCYGLVPNGWTYSTMIKCYCKKGSLDDAKCVFDSMLKDGFFPSVAVATSLIDAFCKKGRLRNAFEVFESMGCEPTIQTYNCLIKGLCYVGRVEDAYELLGKTKEKGSVLPDIYSYSALMDGFCKVGRSDEAMELLDEAVQMGLTPNVVTYNALFHGYSKEGRPMKGFGVLKTMKGRNCLPDCVSYSTLLHGLLKWGKIKAALNVFEEMEENGFKVDEDLMNTLLRGACKVSWKENELLLDVCNLFEMMKRGGVAIGFDTYGFVIRSFTKGRKSEDALGYMEQMISQGYWPNMTTFESVMRALCRDGKLDRAISVFNLILINDRRKLPSRVAYNILINELNQHGSLPRACNVFGLALKQGVIPDKKPIYR